jgi:hypothetical protein
MNGEVFEWDAAKAEANYLKTKREHDNYYLQNSQE